ncbi:hypothetical protein FORC065_2521 [Yersinia enterocolitica]|nr:hypothetical protein FORC065_2521 [Yersinia enterocolitica]
MLAVHKKEDIDEHAARLINDLTTLFLIKLIMLVVKEDNY